MPINYFDGDEDLLQMGALAGYLPSEGVSQLDPMPPEEGGGMPEAPEAMDGGLTPPSYVPQNMGMGYPGSTPPSAPAKVGAGMGMSHRGFSGDKYAQVSKTEDSLTRDYRGADATASAAAAPMQDVAMQAHQSGVLAEQQKAKAHSDQIKAQGEQALVMQRLQDEFAAEETSINAEATARANQAKMDYLAALADFRAAQVDPAQLWGKMGGGERFGMLASAFVHDFLGARGINTSAMATFNKAIDRNIDSQIQAIKTKGEVAEGFKSLWWMQRNQSASDAEARERVRGFLLEGTKQQIIANMSQYESALASAQGQAAIAKVDEELSKTLIEIYRHADQNALSLRNQALEKWKAKLNASLEQQSLNIRRDELALKKLEKKDGANPWAMYVPDVSASGGGKLRYQIIAGSTPKQDEIRNQVGAIAHFDNLYGQFTELQRKVGSLPTSMSASAFLQTEDGAQLIMLRDSMARALAYAKSGKAVTAEEFAHFQRQFPLETWLMRGDREKGIAQTAEILRSEAFSSIAPFVREVGDNETIEFAPGQQMRMRDIVMSPHYNAPGQVPSGVPGEAMAIANKSVMDPPPLSTVENEIKGATEDLAPAVRDEPADVDVSPQAVKLRTAFEEQQSQVHLVRPPAVTRKDQGLVKLYQAAQADGPEAKEAYEALKSRAGEYIYKGETGDDETMFAVYLLNELAPKYGEVRSATAESP